MDNFLSRMDPRCEWEVYERGTIGSKINIKKALVRENRNGR